jgi:hypothetical protein
VGGGRWVDGSRCSGWWGWVVGTTVGLSEVELGGLEFEVGGLRSKCEVEVNVEVEVGSRGGRS